MAEFGALVSTRVIGSGELAMRIDTDSGWSLFIKCWGGDDESGGIESGGVSGSTILGDRNIAMCCVGVAGSLCVEK